MKPRILIGVPYHPSKPYCWPLFMESLHQILAATTSADLEIAVRFDPNLTYGDKDNVKKQRDYFRKLALDGGFDFLFLHGHDTIPPADVIEKLLMVMSCGNDIGVAGGVYFLRPKNGGTLGAVAWRHGMLPEDKDAMLKPLDDLAHTVDGMGLDCALIRRDVLEKISWSDWEVNDDDWPFFERVKAAGYTTTITSSVQCKHYEDADSYSLQGEYRSVLVDEKNKIHGL